MSFTTYWATPNLGVELGLGRATTLDISGNYNPFEKNDGKMFKHWLVQPEFRYWLCERFNGTFSAYTCSAESTIFRR